MIPSEDWYDQYTDEDYDMAVIDEYKGQKTLQFLHSWCQEAPMVLKRKGTGPVIKRRHLPTLFLSNFKPETCYMHVYEKCQSDLDPLKRRLLVVEVEKQIELPWK